VRKSSYELLLGIQVDTKELALMKADCLACVRAKKVPNFYSYLYSYINMPYYPSNQLVNSLLK